MLMAFCMAKVAPRQSALSQLDERANISLLTAAGNIYIGIGYDSVQRFSDNSGVASYMSRKSIYVIIQPIVGELNRHRFRCSDLFSSVHFRRVFYPSEIERFPIYKSMGWSVN
jgi:hypothetical protein